MTQVASIPKGSDRQEQHSIRQADTQVLHRRGGGTFDPTLTSFCKVNVMRVCVCVCARGDFTKFRGQDGQSVALDVELLKVSQLTDLLRQ